MGNVSIGRWRLGRAATIKDVAQRAGCGVRRLAGY